MKDSVTVPLEADKIFREACEHCNVVYFCSQEFEDRNSYELLFDYPHDLYYLGMKVGVDRMHFRHMKDLSDESSV